MATENANNGCSSSIILSPQHPMMTSYSTTTTGMISPLTTRMKHSMNGGQDGDDNTGGLIVGVEECHSQSQQQQQQQQQHQPEHHSHRLSAIRHYNKLKIYQTREKTKRSFDNSKFLVNHIIVGAEIDQYHRGNDNDDVIIPRFDIQELTLGKVLGTGGFGTVVEIKSIEMNAQQQQQQQQQQQPPPAPEDLDKNDHRTSSASHVLDECSGGSRTRERPMKRASLGYLLSLRRDHNRRTNDEAYSGGGGGGGGLRKSIIFDGILTTTLSRDSADDHHHRRRLHMQDVDDATHSQQLGFQQPSAHNFSFVAWRDSAAGEEGNDAVTQEEMELYRNNNSLPDASSSDASNNNVVTDNGAHSTLQSARGRSYYQDTACREGESSYAIKLISPSIVENDFKLFLQAAIDMARETYFLSVLNHPNILKLRGVGQEDMFSPHFFLVLDCLHETLSDRIDGTWKKQHDHLENSIFHLHKSKKLESLWEERVRVMRDLAGALCYMHDLKIIYRDIKPDNIGFDSQGNVKLFDFGLAREIREEDVCTDGTYKLTPSTGSIRYIAPENANNWPYNYLADCYSFGILLWEVTALERPYAHLSPKDIREMVLTWGERPKIKEGWSARVVSLMESSWDAHYSKRPTMREIELVLELELRH